MEQILRIGLGFQNFLIQRKFFSICSCLPQAWNDYTFPRGGEESKGRYVCQSRELGKAESGARNFGTASLRSHGVYADGTQWHLSSPARILASSFALLGARLPPLLGSASSFALCSASSFFAICSAICSASVVIVCASQFLAFDNMIVNVNQISSEILIPKCRLAIAHWASHLA